MGCFSFSYGGGGSDGIADVRTLSTAMVKDSKKRDLGVTLVQITKKDRVDSWYFQILPLDILLRLT